MKKSNVVLIVLSLLLLGVYGCSPALTDFVSLVPEDAYGFVRVDNTATFFTSIDSALEQSGLKDSIAPAGINKLFFDSIKQFTRLEMDEVDPLLPLGFSFSPNSGLDFEPVLSIYIPLKDSNKTYPKITAYLAEQAKEDKKVSSYLVNSYSVITYGLESNNAAPKKTLVLPKDYTFSKDEILVFLPVKKNIEANAIIWNSFSQDFFGGFIESLASQADIFNEQSQDTISKNLVTTIESIQYLAVHVKALKDALEASLDLSFVEGSKSANFLANISAGNLAQSDAQFFDKDNLITLFSSIEPSLAKSSIAQFSSLVSTSSQVDEKALLDIFDSFLSTIGSKLVLGLSYRGNFEKAISQSPDTIPGDLLEIGFSVLLDLKDEQAFEQVINGLPNSPTVQKAIGLLGEELGHSVKLQVSDRTFADLKYKSLGLELVEASTRQGKSNSARNKISEELAAFSLNYVVKSKQLFLISGSKNLDQLKNFVEGKVLESSLSLKKTFQEYLTSIPKGTQTLARINFAPLLSAAFTAFGLSHPAETEQDLGILAYSHIHNKILSSSYYFRWKELGKLVPVLLQVGGF